MFSVKMGHVKLCTTIALLLKYNVKLKSTYVIYSAMIYMLSQLNAANSPGYSESKIII